MIKRLKKSDLLWIITAIIFILFNKLGAIITSVGGSDYGYIWAISLISTLKNEIIFGRDVFFNYGPLGYLLYAFPLKPVLFKFLSFKLITSCCFVYLFYALNDISPITYSKKVSKKTSSLLPFIIFTLLFCIGRGNFEVLACLSAIVFLYREGIQKYIALSILCIYSSFMLFIKFNIGITFILTLFLALFIEFLTHYLEQPKTNFWKNLKNCIIKNKISLLIALPTFTILFAITILTLFQNAEYFMNWLSISLELASSYQEAMTGFASILTIRELFFLFIYGA